MRLGTILGGKAWAAVSTAATEQRREQRDARKDEFAKKKRRAELESAGFRPITPANRPESWGRE